MDLPEAFASIEVLIVLDALMREKPFRTAPMDRVLVLARKDLSLLLPADHCKMSARSEEGPLPEVYELIVR